MTFKILNRIRNIALLMMLKCLLFLSCCCAVAWSVPRKERYDLDLADQHFEEFIRVHQKQYQNENERQMRFGIFKDNLERINKQNMESKTAVFGINKFTDLTLDEFKQTYTGLRPTSNEEDCEKVLIPEINPIPPSIDWRDFNMVTRVKNQQQCGSCWAFSAVGNIESRYAAIYGELKEFSEQQLVDCDRNDQGCAGGLMGPAFIWLKNNGGLESEKDYPYTAKNGNCSFDKTKVQANVTGCGYPYLKNANETTLAQYLIGLGPLAIGVDGLAFMRYKGGILDQCECRGLNHGVLLVGYGEEDNTPYWIIKNSWGEDWGEKGYIRVQRGKDCCGLTGYITTAFVA